MVLVPSDDWLTNKLKEEVIELFQPLYKHILTETEISLISKNCYSEYNIDTFTFYIIGSNNHQLCSTKNYLLSIECQVLL